MTWWKQPLKISNDNWWQRCLLASLEASFKLRNRHSAFFCYILSIVVSIPRNRSFPKNMASARLTFLSNLISINFKTDGSVLSNLYSPTAFHRRLHLISMKKASHICTSGFFHYGLKTTATCTRTRMRAYYYYYFHATPELREIVISFPNVKDYSNSLSLISDPTDAKNRQENVRERRQRSKPFIF